AILAPFGRLGGASPHLISFEFMNIEPAAMSAAHAAVEARSTAPSDAATTVNRFCTLFLLVGGWGRGIFCPWRSSRKCGYPFPMKALAALLLFLPMVAAARPTLEEVRNDMGIRSSSEVRGQRDAVGYATKADAMAKVWE